MATLGGAGVTAYRSVAIGGGSPIRWSPADIGSIAISPDGRLAAGCLGGGTEDTAIRLWDLEANTVRFLEGSAGGSYSAIAFTPDGSLISGDMDGTVKRWNLQDGAETVLATGRGIVLRSRRRGMDGSSSSSGPPNGASMSETWTSELTCYDLVTHTSRVITTHGNRVLDFALDPAATFLVTTGPEGPTRVGPITGEEPHLLPAPISGWAVAISPDGKWIAAGDWQGS